MILPVKIASDRIEEAPRIKVIVESSDKVNMIEMLPDTGADICAGDPEFLEQMDGHGNTLIDAKVRIRAEIIANVSQVGLGIVQQRWHADSGWTTIKAGSRHLTDIVKNEQDARKWREQGARKRREHDARDRKRREQDGRNRRRSDDDARTRSDDDARTRRERYVRRRKSITAGGGGGRRDAESANPTLTPEQQVDAAMADVGPPKPTNTGAVGTSKLRRSKRASKPPERLQDEPYCNK